MKYSKEELKEFGEYLIGVSSGKMEELFLLWQAERSKKQDRLTSAKFINWMTEWYNLWPRMKNSGGKTIQSGFDQCVTRMQRFFKTYKYNPNMVMAATKKYIDDKSKDSFLYCRAAPYFIEKRGEVSDLLTECEILSRNEDNGYEDTISGLI